MPMYRKLPVEIEAREFDGTWDPDLSAWCHGSMTRVATDPVSWQISIRTLEGTMVADPGDFIIRGVKGEFYPCKPDVFAKTYELVE